jgi:dTDP-4-dehydrorhamnose 3,5-epimerase-like enzyme
MAIQSIPLTSNAPLRLHAAPTYSDAKGSLSVLEGADIPFIIQRIYYIHNVPVGAVRGEHGHRELEQVIICLSGAVEVMICDGTQQEFVTLGDPATLLYVPPGRWRSVKFKEAGSVLCVVASRPFDKSDYIYDYEEFLEWKRSCSADRERSGTNVSERRIGRLA